MKFAFRLAALAAVLVASAPALMAHDYQAGDLEIVHPWSRATPQGARVGAGYMVLRNNGAEADRLVSVTSEVAPRAEIHEMAVDADGVMTMREVSDGIEIPAGGEVALEPGGYHLMFIGLEEGLAEGALFTGTLVFERAGEVEVDYAVEPMGGGGHDHGAHGADGDHDH